MPDGASRVAQFVKLIETVSAMALCNWERPLPESRDIVHLCPRVVVDVSRREELMTLDERLEHCSRGESTLERTSLRLLSRQLVRCVR
jgi:hypothetical protein